MLEVLLNFAISFRLHSLPYNCHHLVTITNIIIGVSNPSSLLLSMVQLTQPFYAHAWVFKRSEYTQRETTPQEWCALFGMK